MLFAATVHYHHQRLLHAGAHETRQGVRDVVFSEEQAVVRQIEVQFAAKAIRYKLTRVAQWEMANPEVLVMQPLIYGIILKVVTYRVNLGCRYIRHFQAGSNCVNWKF